MVSAADLQAQVEEVDALAATFPSELELSPAEEVALELARAAAALPAAEDGGGGGGSGGGTLGGELSGFVRLPGPPSAASGFGLHFHLPGGYPGAAPRLRVAWDGPRAGGDELQAAVDAAAAELPGQPALFSALAALAVAAEGLLASAGIGGAPGDRYQHVGGGPPGTTQDAAASMEALDLGGGDEGGGGAAPASGAEAEEAAEVWVRRVLWFHHIKSGTKRKQILDAAAELQVPAGSSWAVYLYALHALIYWAWGEGPRLSSCRRVRRNPRPPPLPLPPLCAAGRVFKVRLPRGCDCRRPGGRRGRIHGPPPPPALAGAPLSGSQAERGLPRL